MTKKDYELIASVINDNVKGQLKGSHRIVSDPNTMISNIAYGLSDKLKETNPKYNELKFLKRCFDLS